MNFGSRSLMASLADASAVLQDGITDWSPTACILNVNATLPIRMGGATVELGNVFAHTRQGTEDSGLAFEVAGGALKLYATPRAVPSRPVAPAWIGLSHAGFIPTAITAIFLPTTMTVKRLSAKATSQLQGSPPAGGEVAGLTAIGSFALRILNREGSSTMSADTVAAFPAERGVPAGGSKQIAASFTWPRLIHANSLTGKKKIVKVYVRIAHEPIALVEAQPNLFEKKPVQMPL